MNILPMNRRQSIALLFGLASIPVTHADSTLEYLFTENGKSGQPQAVLIKEGKILVKGAGGNENTDYLFSSTPDQLFIIDHRKHKVTTLDDRQVNQIAKQTETVQPLLQGLGEQISKLDPQQRGKWEKMLGGNVSLDKLAEAAKPVTPTHIVKTGRGKTVAGVSCEQMDVLQGKTLMAQFCLADPEELKISAQDYAVIRSLLDFSERVIAKTQGLAGQFGVKIPAIALQGVTGVPVEMRDLSSTSQNGLTLNRVVISAVSTEAMQVPNDYRSEPLTLWK
ncbi:MAG: hypothetical protein PHE55_17760 [Methylococcaceae bacterium]|nr:hypothetical protein [Methylococcaceae bacterium]